MAEHEDVYKERYLAHQAKKRAQLAPTSGEIEWQEHTDTDWLKYIELQRKRRTQRTFNGEPIPEEKIDKLAEAMALCPSSCNRQAIYGKFVSEREEKELLSGLLVGGVGWSYRADKLLLLFADMTAYHNPAEKDFMPYLDAGAMIKTIYDTCTVLDVGVGYVNPNIREANKDFFNERFGGENLRFCGVLALGNFDRRAGETPKRPPTDVWIKK